MHQWHHRVPNLTAHIVASEVREERIKRKVSRGEFSKKAVRLNPALDIPKLTQQRLMT